MSDSIRIAQVSCLVLLGAALVLVSAPDQTKPLRPAPPSLLDGAKGADKTKEIVQIRTCEDVSTALQNPPPAYVSPDNCGPNATFCLDCDQTAEHPNPSQMDIVTYTNGYEPPNNPGLRDPVSIPCGELRKGTCQQINGVWECTWNGINTNQFCADVVQYSAQPFKQDPPSGQ